MAYSLYYRKIWKFEPTGDIAIRKELSENIAYNSSSFRRTIMKISKQLKNLDDVITKDIFSMNEIVDNSLIIEMKFENKNMALLSKLKLALSNLTDNISDIDDWPVEKVIQK